MIEFDIPVILASASPRRSDLLKGLIKDFKVVPADVDETPEPGESPLHLAIRLATTKAEFVSKGNEDSLVIGADTVVELDGRSLGKPGTPEEAVKMLHALSGRTHRVITAVSFVFRGRKSQFAAPTEVTFREISEAEIRSYVASGEPLDKAGAYAIQEGAKDFARQVRGSLTNVIGLPMEELQRKLVEFRRPV